MINSKQKHLSCKKEKTAAATKRDCGQRLCYHQHPAGDELQLKGKWDDL